MTRRSLPIVIRAALGLLLAIAGLTSSIGLGPVAAVTLAKAVTWSIDHTAKTITADVRITLVPTCATAHFQPAKFGEERASWCTVTPEIAAQIKANIESVWNGHKYYCYDIIVRVDIQIDDDPTGEDPRNRLKVFIDRTPAAPVSTVAGRKAAGAPWNGSSPSDAVRPVNNGAASSTWAYPPAGQGANIYAHEAGHILGLDDGYEEYVDANGNTQLRTRLDGPEDLMSDQNNSNIDRSTLRRMVERAGYTKTDLKCNYKIDQQSLGGRITGKKCDPLGGQWVAQGTYSFAGANGSQEWIITMDEVTRRGNFVYADHQVAEFALGIQVFTDGAAAGQATLTIDDELKARFHLVEQVHTYTSTTSQGGTGTESNAPLQSIDLVWEPIGRC